MGAQKVLCPHGTTHLSSEIKKSPESVFKRGLSDTFQLQIKLDPVMCFECTFEQQLIKT